jgi:hypothetical protein
LFRGSTQGKAQITNREGQSRLTRVNVRIKVIIIIVLKPDCVVNQSKAWVTGWKSQPMLTRVNVWIKVIIFIVLKPNLKFDLKQNSGHWSEGSARLTQFKKKTNNQSNLILTKINCQKSQ